jgi:putative hydrolase of the HAD superfamily
VNRPNAILFDAGGTLVTIHPGKLGDLVEPITGARPDPARMFEAHYRAMDAVLHNVGVTDQPDWWQWWLRTYLGFAGVDSSDDEAAAALSRTRGLWRQPIPGVIDAVTAIKDAGLAVAVVSNADGSVATDLDAAGYDGLFDIIVDSTRVGVSKPDPAIFAIALEALGVAADDSWYIGDSPLFDKAGAANAGLAEFVLVDPIELYDHRPSVATVAELPRLLGL